MVIADRFVYLHLGKTGGTFVETVLDRLLADGDAPHFNTLRPEDRARFGSEDQHEVFNELPVAYRDRPILFTIRNPFDWYVSLFEFPWWKDHPESLFRPDRVVERFPDFPNLAFGEFLHALNDWPAGLACRRRDLPWDPALCDAAGIGFYTYYFATTIYPDALAMFRALPDPGADRWRAALPDVRFVRTDDLNRGLHAFLRAMGYPAGSIDFILGLEKILPPSSSGRDPGRSWESYYSPDLRAFVRDRDRVIFEMFGVFDD